MTTTATRPPARRGTPRMIDNSPEREFEDIQPGEERDREAVEREQAAERERDEDSPEPREGSSLASPLGTYAEPPSARACA